MNNTTRRYPRTLSDAYPDVRASSGDWVRYDVTSAGHRAVFLLSIVGCIGFLTWAICKVLS